MRKLETIGSGAAVLDAADNAPSRSKSRTQSGPRRIDPIRPRREMVDDYADDADTEAFLRASGRNRRLRRGLIPRTRNGWIAFGVSAAVLLAGMGTSAFYALRYVTTSERFRIPSSQAIEIDGNSHVSRAQMISVFGEDVERNLFRVPLADRRAQLEQMPWVEHATVMRLLPNRIRVHVTERVPVAFVRDGGNIGLVDSSGVLLDIPPDAPGNPSYTFPVITGLKAGDTPEARQERMKLYAAFLRDLDSDGKGTSAQLSEIDLSDPEDVKALIPDHNAEVLVHFGQERFLDRYHQFEQHIGEWRTQYPRLASVDMRYEHQVVLQMPPKDSTVTGNDGGTVAANAPAAQEAAKPAVTTVAKAAPAPAAKPAAVAAAAVSTATKVAVHPPAAITDRHPERSEGPASPAVAKTVPPKPVPAVVATKPAPAAKPAAHNTRAEAKEAATRKRVEAIRAWMAKREKARKAAAN